MLDPPDTSPVREADDTTALAARDHGLRRNGPLAECVGDGLAVGLDTGPGRIELAHWTLRRGRAQVGMHRHPWWEITWLLHGSFIHENETHRQPFDLTRGQACLIPPGVTHRWRTDSDWLVLFGLMIDWPHANPAPEDRPRHLPADSDQQAMLRQLAREARCPDRHGGLVMRGLLEALLGLALRPATTAPPRPAEPDTAGRAVAHAVRAFIQEHLSEPLSAEIIARRFDVSARHLNRLLGEHFGCSTRQLIRHLRLERATRLLNDPQRSIKAIALSTGFRDPDYFSRVFTQAHGRPPSAYRRHA